MPALNLQIATSADDAFEDSAGAVNTTATEHLLLLGTTWLGLRFVGVTIPRSSTITSATLTVYLANAKYDNAQVDIYGQAVDNAAAFTTAAYSISSRSRTATKTTWSNGDLAAPAWRTAPDLAAVITEIISRPGWSIGNALALILDDVNSGLAVRTRDYGSSWGATLAVTYTPVTTVALGQAVETDAAAAVMILRRYALGQAVETDRAIALRPRTRDITLTAGRPMPRRRALRPQNSWAAGDACRRWTATLP